MWHRREEVPSSCLRRNTKAKSLRLFVLAVGLVWPVFFFCPLFRLRKKTNGSVFLFVFSIFMFVIVCAPPFPRLRKKRGKKRSVTSEQRKSYEMGRRKGYTQPWKGSFVRSLSEVGGCALQNWGIGKSGEGKFPARARGGGVRRGWRPVG